MEQTSSRQDSQALDKVVRIGQLMDLYSGLLTDRQRQFVQLHYEEDLSFGEIARAHGVSRQAIHDAVKHAEKALEDYEAKLGFLKRGVTRPSEEFAAASKPAPGRVSESQQPVGSAQEREVLPRILSHVEGVRETLRRSGGILYNTEGLSRQLEELASEVRAALDGSHSNSESQPS